jgi:hypothetical protein
MLNFSRFSLLARCSLFQNAAAAAAAAEAFLRQRVGAPPPTTSALLRQPVASDYPSAAPYSDYGAAVSESAAKRFKQNHPELYNELHTAAVAVSEQARPAGAPGGAPAAQSAALTVQSAEAVAAAAFAAAQAGHL